MFSTCLTFSDAEQSPRTCGKYRFAACIFHRHIIRHHPLVIADSSRHNLKKQKRTPDLPQNHYLIRTVIIKHLFAPQLTTQKRIVNGAIHRNQPPSIELAWVFEFQYEITKLTTRYTRVQGPDSLLHCSVPSSLRVKFAAPVEFL